MINYHQYHTHHHHHHQYHHHQPPSSTTTPTIIINTITPITTTMINYHQYHTHHHYQYHHHQPPSSTTIPTINISLPPLPSLTGSHSTNLTYHHSNSLQEWYCWLWWPSHRTPIIPCYPHDLHRSWFTPRGHYFWRSLLSNSETLEEVKIEHIVRNNQLRYTMI